MNKYFTKFSVMLVMTFVVMLGCATSAFAADDDSVLGVANLNNTAENSAKIGDKLALPEIGWKRYDDTNTNITYSSGFEIDPETNSSSTYNDIKFSFYGSELRLLGRLGPEDSNAEISFDGGRTFEALPESVSEPITSGDQILVFQKTGLEKKVHHVVIKIHNHRTTGSGVVMMDAIDIDDDGYLAPYTESITLDKSTMGLIVGDSEQLKATTIPAGAQVTWTSSDDSIATVDENGNVTGIKKGQVTITAAKADGLAATCTVNVIDPNDSVLGVANLNDTAENSAMIGDKLTLPEIGWKRYDDTNTNISYDSTFINSRVEDSYSSLDYNGTFHGSTIFSSGGDHYIKFSFYGSELRLFGRFEDSNAEISFDGGRTFETLSESISEPITSGNQFLVFQKTGLEKKVHDVVININPDQSAFVVMDAIDIDDDGYLAPYTGPVNDESITLDKSTMDLTVGDSEQLTATTTPAGAQVTWTSSDDSIATVDENGNVTGIEEGQVTITAVTADGFTATCTVNVDEPITLDKSTMDLTLGNSKQLTATTIPAGAQVTWTSSDDSIATVDENGNVTGIKKGQVTITAATADGLTATCTVNVIDPNDSVSGVANLNNTAENSAMIGDKLTLPEIGWKRYDDNNTNISYSDSFYNHTVTDVPAYDGTYHTVLEGSPGDHYIKFSFYGSKLRLLGALSELNGDAKISFDGGKTFETFSEYISEGWTSDYEILVFQKTGLEKKVHDVVISIPSYGTYLGFDIDAIDIDDDGYLAPPTNDVSDASVSGVANLNNTAENSAMIGDKLTLPEIGWKRYDDNNTNISYSGFNNNIESATDYNGTFHSSDGYDGFPEDAYIKFSFYGSELRLLGGVYGYGFNPKISFDGGQNFETLSETIIEPYTRFDHEILVFQKTGLEKKVHDVVIDIPITTETGTVFMDAIDIDDDGYLAPYKDPANDESITLDKSTMDLTVGDSEQLTATTTPAGAQVTWTSSDNSIATVDETGNVTGIREGQVTITAATADGLTATCTVNVNKEDESITLDKSTMDLSKGDSEQLTATTTPAGAKVTWTSSDDSIATVDENGNVTGIKKGQVTITAATADGLTATCTVNVTNPRDSGTPDDGNGTSTEPEDPTGGKKLFIELVDGNIKQYDVDDNEIDDFINWYNNRDNDASESPYNAIDDFIDWYNNRDNDDSESPYDKIHDFIDWYSNKNNDDSELPYYEFTKSNGYKDYVIHDQIVLFEVK